MEELTKEEWQKILTSANQTIKTYTMMLAIEYGTADLAREHLKILDDAGKNTKLA